jgi:hypothetical protein
MGCIYLERSQVASAGDAPFSMIQQTRATQAILTATPEHRRKY